MKRNAIYFAISVIIITVILFVDIAIPLGVAVGVLYAAVILVNINTTSYKYVWHSAIVTSLLVVLGFFISPSGGELWKVISNRAISLFSIWIAAVLVVKLKKDSISKIKYQKKIRKEKETLLKEIHHRVKNNLQIISSLLSMQKDGVDDKFKENLNTAINRVKSMAIVHEMLYQVEDFSTIDFESYLVQLIGEIVSDTKGHVELKIDIPNIGMNIETAMPLGLMINEIISNSIKHGIKKEEPIEVYVRIDKSGENNYILYIGDNGVGFSEEDVKNKNSLGLKLIKAFSRQLKSNIVRDKSKKGVHYIMNFDKLK